MSERRDQEFYELQHLAFGYLTRPETAPEAASLQRWQLRVRLWHYPSFSENRSWVVFQRHDRGTRQFLTMVRQVTWDRMADAGRMLDPLVGLAKGFHTEPTLEVRDWVIDSALFESRMDALAVISFPAFAKHGIGIDGETFGIAFPDYLRRASIEWWCKGPEAWREVTAWAADMRDWLTHLISTSEQPPSSHAL